MDQLTDTDLRDVTHRANLDHTQLRQLFTQLHIEEAVIEEAERNDDTSDLRLQAFNILHSWRKTRGQDATRRTICEALHECGYSEALELLVNKWDLSFKEKNKICPTSDTSCELDEMLIQAGLEVDYWVGILKTKLDISLPQQIQHLDETNLKKLNACIRQEWEKKALKKLIGIRTDSTSTQAERGSEPDIVVGLTQAGLEAKYWANVLEERLGITRMGQTVNLTVKDFKTLKAEVRYDWEENALRTLFCITNEANDVLMGELQKKYKKKIEETQNLLQEIVKLRQDGIHITGEAMIKKLDQLREYIAIPYPKQQWIDILDEKGLDHMISEMNSELQCLSKLVEGRPRNGAIEIIENASGGLALRGILVGKAFRGDCVKQVVLSTPTDVVLMSPAIEEVDYDVHFTSKAQSDNFHCSLDKMGYRFAVDMKGGGWGLKAEARFSKKYEDEKEEVEESHKRTHFESRVICSVVPTAACELNPCNLKLSQQALGDLKIIDKFLVATKNLELVYKRCEEFLMTYGSHINSGILHFGGVNKFEATYKSDTGSKTTKTKSMLEEALNAYVYASNSGFRLGADGSASADRLKRHASFKHDYEQSDKEKTSLKNSRNGGPSRVGTFHLWKIGLVACNTTWALIDRGRSLFTDFVGIWNLISNHKGDFHEPDELKNSLITVWEKMSGAVAVSTVKERTLIKELDAMDRLIDMIPTWISCPIFTKKCVGYLQEILKIVEHIEEQTGTNKYWEKTLCTEGKLHSFLGKVVDVRDEFDPKDKFMIRYLIRKLLNPLQFRDFPGKQKIIKWVEVTEQTKEVQSILARTDIKNINDLIENLKKGFIPTLRKEHENNVKGSVQVSDSINTKATFDLVRSLDQLQKYLQSSGELHQAFFLRVAMSSLHYDWHKMEFHMVLTMEQLDDFVDKFVESWKKFQFQKRKGVIQLEAFLIHTLLSSGHLDKGRKSSEDEFSKITENLKQVLSTELKTVLYRYTSYSPYNWVEMTEVTAELAKGTLMKVLEGKEVEIRFLLNLFSSQNTKTSEESHVLTTKSGIKAQGDFTNILRMLGLDKHFPCKLTLLDAMDIKRPIGHPELVDLPRMIIHKLFMIDFHARDQPLSVVDESSSEEKPDDEGDDGEGDMDDLLEMQMTSGKEDNTPQFNSLDAIVAIFTCSDHFLKQTLAQKLFVCKLAVPFMYPLGSELNVGMSLWALRDINVQWHNKYKEVSETPVTEKPFPLVTFVRVGRPLLSKSKLMNNILSDDIHDTFFHHDCNNGTLPRMISDGLVECSWFITAGREKEHLPNTTMFLNLRGDAVNLEKQMKILREISSVMFVIVTAKDLTRDPHVNICQQILQSGAKLILFLSSENNKYCKDQLHAFFESVGKDFLKCVPIIYPNTKQGRKKNASVLKTEARKKLSEKIAECSGITIEACARRAMKMGITVDEYADEACVKGKALAEKVVSHIKYKDIADCRDLLIPLQGDEWIEFCKLIKKQYRTKGSSTCSSADSANQVKLVMDLLREKQVEACRSRLPTFIKDFMSTLFENPDVVKYFLKWVNLFFNSMSRANLPGLRRQYHRKWNQFQETKNKQGNEQKKVDLKSQMDDAESQLARASLGVENLFRELVQIYEAVKESRVVGKQTKAAVEYLPKIAARLLLNGNPLEVIDGDASSVPIVWVSAVLNNLGKIIGEKRLFVLSVLGIQSSGKSTLLNTMFGLHFAVSAGRCTRGAYMQLIHVDDKANLPFDFIVVVDTEGLRAPELGHLRCEHDNELATLVIGIGDVTIINIKGENATEMKDILQIAVHAFLRMNRVGKHIQDHRTCIFAHQNVPAVNAEELMMKGSQKLQECLDDMVKEAAISENIEDIHSFSQIIKFDVQKHVWYFSDLWQGNPPMAPANPGYSEKVSAVRQYILEDIARKQTTFLTAPDLSMRIADLWRGVLSDDFVFSFRNSLEVNAYNSLQSEYYTLEWALQDELKSWLHESEIKLKMCEDVDDLEKSLQSLIREFNKVLEEKSQKTQASLKIYFKQCNLKEIVNQWEHSKMNQLEYAVQQQQDEGVADLRSVKDARRVEILQAQNWSQQEKDIMHRAVTLADKLKGEEATEDQLEQKFGIMWASIERDLGIQTIEKDLDIDKEMERILYDRFHDNGTLLREELQRHPLTDQLEDTSLGSSVALDYITNNDISLKTGFWGILKNTGQMLLDARLKTLRLTGNILVKIKTYLKTLSKHHEKLKIGHIVEVVHKLVKEIESFNQEESGKLHFKIRTEYTVKLAVHVSRHCAKEFKMMQKEYNKNHGVKAKLENYKNAAWSLFKNKVKQSTEDVMAADLLLTQLMDIIRKEVKYAIPKQCISEVLRDFGMTKYGLIVKMMDDLAEKGNFENYESYITNAEQFALRWITQYTNEKVFSRQGTGRMSRYADIATSHISQIMRCIRNSVYHATPVGDGQESMTMAQWKIRFCERVSEKIAVPVSSLSVIVDRKVGDFSNLQRIILDELDDIETKLKKEFGGEANQNIYWEGTPPPLQILERIWGCPEQCPFCNEPCADTKADHYDLSGRSHMCVQHRPQGIGGIRWSADEANHCKGQLVHETCNYFVQQDVISFNCSGNNYKCKKSGKCSTIRDKYHKYTEYRIYMPDWDIAPDRTNGVSKYWMWFMATYQHSLKDMHNAKLPDIPENWTKITKEEALNDLRKIHP